MPEQRRLMSEDEMVAMIWNREIRLGTAKVTNVSLAALVNNKWQLDQPVVWTPAMPDNKYKVTVNSDALPSGMTAAPLETSYTPTGCLIRIISSALIVLGQTVNVAAWK